MECKSDLISLFSSQRDCWWLPRLNSFPINLTLSCCIVVTSSPFPTRGKAEVLQWHAWVLYSKEHSTGSQVRDFCYIDIPMALLMMWTTDSEGEQCSAAVAGPLCCVWIQQVKPIQQDARRAIIGAFSLCRSLRYLLSEINSKHNANSLLLQAEFLPFICS